MLGAVHSSLGHVDVSSSESGMQDRTSIDAVWSASSPGTGETLNEWLALPRSMDSVTLGMQFVQQGHALAPEKVGADTKRIRVAATAAEWV